MTTTNSPQVLKDGSFVLNQWKLIEEIESLTLTKDTAHYLLPLEAWIEKPLPFDYSQNALWLKPDDALEGVIDLVKSIPMIAIQFPSFVDGRGLSLAYLLRCRYQFTGELRAIGEIKQELIQYMFRCGFNAFELNRVQGSIENMLHPYTIEYQASLIQ